MGPKTNNERGQGLLEYALMIAIAALLVIACTAACWFVLIAGILIPRWPDFVAWGSNLVANVQRGDPTAIFIAFLIFAALLYLIYHRR